MHRFFYRFLFVFTLVTMIACEQVPSINQNNTELFFFDLKGFFDTEIDYLNEHQPSLYKKIRYKEQEEEKVVSIKDWKKELKVFYDSDINKPSWKDKYTLDSTQLDNGLSLLHYQAIDENLSTQVLDVKLKGKEVHSILIIKKASNQVYESQQYLTYIPKKSYSIKKTQDVVFFDEDDYNIDAKYMHS